MRPDIKLGIVISMVVVFVAGSYFMYRASDEAPISLASKDDDAKTTDSKATKAQPKKKGATPATGKKPTPQANRKNNRQTALNPQSSNSDRTKAAKTPKKQPRRTPRATPAGRKIEPKTNTANKQLANNDEAAKKSVPANDSKNQELALQTNNPSNAAPTRSTPAPREQNKPVSLTATPANGNAVTTPPSNNGVPVETHRAQPGDTFGSLAQRYYGDARHARFLIDNNPHLGTTGRLLTGQVVKIPSLPASAAPTSSVTPASKSPIGARTYTVQSGDSFYKIAASQLGDASRWNELFELNKELVKGDPKRLQIGTVLRLPN